MLSAGFVSKCVTDFVGRQNLRKFKVRFATRVWPGDTITCSGTVTRKVECGGKKLIEGEVVARNQKGETAIVGSFTAELPSRP
jgi:acyl dehydratase